MWHYVAPVFPTKISLAFERTRKARPYTSGWVAVGIAVGENLVSAPNACIRGTRAVKRSDAFGKTSKDLARRTNP